MKKIMVWAKNILDKTRVLDFTAPLLLRLYLAPIFWMAGTSKLAHMQSTIAWFGNPDWGLGLPFPTLMAYSAALTETVGAVLLVLGLATRWISIPLLITMLVAMFAVHWDNGWLAIAHDKADMTTRLSEFLVWLKSEYPHHHSNITELGRPVMLNNGIEFAATYFIMLLTLFFYGAGKYVSIDYWFARWLK